MIILGSVQVYRIYDRLWYSQRDECSHRIVVSQSVLVRRVQSTSKTVNYIYYGKVSIIRYLYESLVV